MTFFYDLNKKLDAIRELPSTTHGQLNERAMSQHAKGIMKYDNKEVDEGLGDMVRKAGGAVKNLAGKALNTVGHGNDADMIRDLQKKMNMPQTGIKPTPGNKTGSSPVRPAYDPYDDATVDAINKANPPKPRKPQLDPERPYYTGPAIPAKHNTYDRKSVASQTSGSDSAAYDKFTGRDNYEESAMTAKQKSFAKLAPPKNKITFADKIAGAKKEVDEMLGDVAAEAMKSALGRGKKVVADEASQDNAFTAHKRPKIEKPAVGTITRGSKHDVEEIPGGRRVTRRVDPAGISVGADDDKPADGEKRGRGRPKGPAKAPERVTGGATKHKGGRKTNEGDHESDEIKQAMAMLKKAGYEITKADKDEEQVNEKAVSKKQQRFMGMVHAAQKGEKPASKEVAKVAKGMGKKDAEDFAATKHKGLPEKKKPEAKKDDAPKKKKEKTQEAGGTETPTASSGFSYGKGIYDSINRELEAMIAESMSVTMSMNNDTMNGGPGKNLTVNATDEDAVKLGALLKMAGVGGGESSCGCGQPGCGCAQQSMDEAYGDTDATENAPDYPTETETSADPFQYSGGINKPKSTGQTTVPVIASQDDRQESYAEAEEDALHRMMEMAGIAEAKGKKPDFLDVDKDGNKKESFKKAVDDKEEEVKESIFDLTNQWQAYKG